MSPFIFHDRILKRFIDWCDTWPDYKAYVRQNQMRDSWVRSRKRGNHISSKGLNNSLEIKGSGGDGDQSEEKN